MESTDGSNTGNVVSATGNVTLFNSVLCGSSLHFLTKLLENCCSSVVISKAQSKCFSLYQPPIDVICESGTHKGIDPPGSYSRRLQCFNKTDGILVSFLYRGTRSWYRSTKPNSSQCGARLLPRKLRGLA